LYLCCSSDFVRAVALCPVRILGYSSEVPIRESKVPDLSQDRYHHGGYAVDYELLAIYQEDEAGWGPTTTENSIQCERQIQLPERVDPQVGFGAERAGCARKFQLASSVILFVVESNELD
jgi:hypothetical protein